MTRIAQTPAALPVRRPVAPAAVKPVAAAPAPQAAPKAQAALAGDRPKKFADLESYKAYVQRSEATGLPAARQQVAAAKATLAQADQALAAKKREANHQPLEQALAAAETQLTATMFPMRPQAAKKTDEAKAVQAQIGGIMREIAEAQRQIASAEGNKAARSRDFWWGDNSKDTGWDVAADVLGSIGDASTISSANRKIKALIDRKVALEQQVLSLTMEATALQHQPGEPALIATAREKRDAAKAAFEGAVAAIAPEAAAQAEATRGLATAQGGLDRLEGVKKELTDYTKQFGLFTRIKLKLSNWGWRKELDAFWTSKGL